MKLMSMKQYSKMTKASLVRKITKALKKLPKRTLVKMCYELEKRRLPTISTTKKTKYRKRRERIGLMPRLTARKAYVKPRRRSARKPRRLVKGSPEAKRYMAKLRRMRR